MGPVTYKVEMPQSMPRAHNVFHISKLKKYYHPENESGPLSITVDADGTVEQEVKAILGKKRINRTVHYLFNLKMSLRVKQLWMCQFGLTTLQRIDSRI